ncbi:MAG: RNA polymerase sigma factor [Gammaproteobacteria bacterium]|nr:RNA polymerase sigma factor [Gammaproteobacteria bacterium]
MHRAQIELLVIESQIGNMAAFEQLCRYFHPRLLRFAFKICHSEEMAHDAVQNAWLAINKSLARVKDPRAFNSWVYQATRWQVLDLLRAQQRDEQWRVQDDVEAIAPEQADSDSVLLGAINMLPTIDREVVHLFYLEQMTIQEISLVLEIPDGTVKSRLNRARNSLRDKLTGADYEYRSTNKTRA